MAGAWVREVVLHDGNCDHQSSDSHGCLVQVSGKKQVTNKRLTDAQQTKQTRLPYAKDKVDKVENPYSGCRGCASGRRRKTATIITYIIKKGKAGEKNIFGNEFGISLVKKKKKRTSVCFF